MKNRIVTLPIFDKRYKRFAKKFPSLNKELLALKALLLENPKSGVLITENTYKIIKQSFLPLKTQKADSFLFGVRLFCWQKLLGHAIDWNS